MTAKEYLLKYKDAVREAREMELKITQLRLRYGAPGAVDYSDMPRTHSNSDLSDYMVKLSRLTDLLLKKYEKCVGLMVDIEMRLDRIEGRNAQLEREVLRHKYTDVDDKGRLPSWEAVADSVHFSVRNVRRIHGTALQHFPLPEEQKKE